MSKDISLQNSSGESRNSHLMIKNFDCTYIGHGTVLTNIAGSEIITDPHFSKRALFSKRKVPLSINPAILDNISGVLISHMHYSHLNIASFKYISSALPVIVPEGTLPVLANLISNPIIELSHWATHELNDNTKITAVPVSHRGGRVSQLRFTSSNGYIIEKNGVTLFFCGDSAYGQHFSEIGNLYNIDLALLPIGSYAPQWLMKKLHMTPEEAVKAFEDLKAQFMIPIHWGTFRLSLENPTAPAKWIEKILEAQPELKEKLFLLNPGESKNINFEASEKNPDTKNRVEQVSTQTFTPEVPLSSQQ